MNKLRPVLVREGILDSDKVCRLALVTQLFFRNLLHVCDGADRFDANADDLRLDLYRRALDRVKKQHIEQWLQECREARLIELYTRSGKRFGRVLNYGQRDAKRKAIHPAPEDEAELPLVTDDPPPAPRPPRTKPRASAPPSFKGMESNRIEGRETARNAPPTPSLSDDDWLRNLMPLYPHVNLVAELAACQKKFPSTGRVFFETKWLANCEKAVTLKTANGQVITIEPEPEAWKLYLKDTYEGESWAASAAAYPWAEMPPQWRAKIFKEMTT